jgi:hypothetical protein
MKIEKFDLEKVIHGAKVVTRDGREVTELSKFNTYRKLCLYGVVDDEVECWTIDGQYSERGTSNMDLYLVGKVRRAWSNIYYDTEWDFLFIGETADSLEYAKSKAKSDSTVKYIKTIEITDEV